MSSKPTVFNYQEYVGLKGQYEDLKMENKELADRINTLHEVIDKLLKERMIVIHRKTSITSSSTGWRTSTESNRTELFGRFGRAMITQLWNIRMDASYWTIRRLVFWLR